MIIYDYVLPGVWAIIGVAMIALMSKRWTPQFDGFVGKGTPPFQIIIMAVVFMALAWPLLAAWLLFLETRYRDTGSPVPSWPSPIQRVSAPELAAPSEKNGSMAQFRLHPAIPLAYIAIAVGATALFWDSLPFMVGLILVVSLVIVVPVFFLSLVDYVLKGDDTL